MDPRRDLDQPSDLDALLARATPPVSMSSVAVELASALPGRCKAADRRQLRWSVTAILAGVLTLGATAAVAAPLLLQPLPGYTTLASFSFGVAPDEPGVRCQTIIGIKPTPTDPEFDAAAVSEFSTYIRAQRFSIPVPDAARRPFTDPADDVYESAGFTALSDSYSRAVGDVYARFPHQDALSHSATLQDSVSCSGHQ